MQDSKQSRSCQQVQAAAAKMLNAALASPANMSAALQNGIATILCASWSELDPESTAQPSTDSQAGMQLQNDEDGRTSGHAGSHAQAEAAEQEDDTRKPPGRSAFTFAQGSGQSSKARTGTCIPGGHAPVRPEVSNSSSVPSADHPLHGPETNGGPSGAPSPAHDMQTGDQIANAAGIKSVQPMGSNETHNKPAEVAVSSSPGCTSAAKCCSSAETGSQHGNYLDRNRCACCVRLLPLMAALADDKAGRTHLARSLVGRSLCCFMTCLPKLQPGKKLSANDGCTSRITILWHFLQRCQSADALYTILC